MIMSHGMTAARPWSIGSPQIRPLTVQGRIASNEYRYGMPLKNVLDCMRYCLLLCFAGYLRCWGSQEHQGCQGGGEGEVALSRPHLWCPAERG